MIRRTSIFRRLPADLPTRTVLFLDSLRLSAQSAALAHKKLVRLLRRLMEQDTERPLRDEAVEGILFAFAIVDSANRFREVLRVFPGLKQNHVFKSFMKATVEVEQLRHVLQHLNRELDTIRDQAAAAMGTITWLGPSPSEHAPPSAWVLQPGSFYGGQITHSAVIDRLARLGPGQIDQVALQTSRVRVDLTDTVKRMDNILLSLKPSLTSQARAKPRLGSDVLLTFSLEPVDDPPAPGAA